MKVKHSCLMSQLKLLSQLNEVLFYKITIYFYLIYLKYGISNCN